MGETLQHHLRVEVGYLPETREATVEHDPGCPYEDSDVGFGAPVRNYLCDVGRVVSSDGLDALVDLDKLEPGRYEIEAWSEAGRWYGAAWSDPDGGLRLVEAD